MQNGGRTEEENGNSPLVSIAIAVVAVVVDKYNSGKRYNMLDTKQ